MFMMNISVLIKGFDSAVPTPRIAFNLQSKIESNFAQCVVYISISHCIDTLEIVK